MIAIQPGYSPENVFLASIFLYYGGPGDHQARKKSN